MSEQQQPKEPDCIFWDHCKDTKNGECIGTENCAFHISCSRPHPAPQAVKFPNSTELLLTAHTEWKNRIARKHTHDEIPWVDGWIHGFLTPHPEYKKRSEEHDAAIERQAREDEREKVLKILGRFGYKGAKAFLEDYWRTESLRHSTHGQSEPEQGGGNGS